MSSETPEKSQAEAKQPDDSNTDPETSTTPARFLPEEEASLLSESHTKKSLANDLFASGRYSAAIDHYDEAAALCPHYLDYELAVLQSNIAACHLKLSTWAEAAKSATTALEGLDRVEKRENEDQEQPEKSDQEQTDRDKKAEKEEEADEEIISAGAKSSAPTAVISPSSKEAARKKRQEDIRRIRAKALMRRARARSSLTGWSDLAGAEEDYKTLAGMDNLPATDRRIVAAQLRTLPPRVKEAQEREVGEMWGKLKDLGNGLLKPFGLSTDNFALEQDEKTGGYSMNFKQNNQ